MNTKFLSTSILFLLLAFSFQAVKGVTDDAFEISATRISPNKYKFKAVPRIPTNPGVSTALPSQYHFVWILEGKYIEFGPVIDYSFRHSISSGSVEPVILRYKKRYETNNDPGDERLAAASLPSPLPSDSELENTPAPFRTEVSRLPRWGNRTCPSYESFLRVATGSSTSAKIVKVAITGPAMWQAPPSHHNKCKACSNWILGNFPEGFPRATPILNSSIPPEERWFLVEDVAYESGLAANRGDILIPFYSLKSGDPSVCFDVRVIDLSSIYAQSLEKPNDDYVIANSLSLNNLRDSLNQRNDLGKCFPVVDSWDPNTKFGYPEGTANPGDFITYTILWENTGDAFESTVHIRDQLSQSLSPNIQMLDSNYPLINSTPAGSRALHWTMTGLGPGKIGFLQFKAQVTSATPPNTLIENDAEINFVNAEQFLRTPKVIHNRDTLRRGGNGADGGTDNPCNCELLKWMLVAVVFLQLLLITLFLCYRWKRNEEDPDRPRKGIC